MKSIEIVSSKVDFDWWVNNPDIEILQLDIQGVEGSFRFQECFIAVIYYRKRKKNIFRQLWENMMTSKKK